MQRLLAWFNVRSAIILISVVSIVVKVSYIQLWGGGLSSFPVEGTDSGFYETAARNLLQTGSYSFYVGVPTIGMPPGESFFLALLYSVSNYSIVFAKLAHVGLLTLVAVLVYLVGKDIVNNLVGLGTGMLIAIDPAQAYLAGTFLSEPLFIFLMVLAIHFLVQNNRHSHWGWLVGAGICFGLAGLARNQGWLFAIALWLGAIVTFGRLIKIRNATIVLLVTFAVIAPWTFRNYQVSGRLILVSLEGGLTLWSGNNPEFVWRQPMPMSLPIYGVPAGLSGDQVDDYYRNRALDWIESHPIDFVVNGIRKVIVLYSFDPMSTRPEVVGLYRLVGLIPYGLVLPFIVLGLLLNWRQEKIGVILWYILFTTAISFVFFGDSRMRAPIQPYLYLFGAAGFWQVIQRFLQHDRLSTGTRKNE